MHLGIYGRGGVIALFGASLVAGEAEVADLVSRQAAFTFELYGALREETPGDENLVFSPYSISTAMSLAYEGARGETRQEMSDALNISGLDDLPLAAADLADNLESLGDSVGLRIGTANGFWVREGWSLLEPYQALAETYYDAEIASADFAGAPEEAKETINTWVADKTEDRIPELLDSVAPETFAVLVNAIYFYGSWHYPFVPAKTRAEPFRLGSGEVREVYMMRQEESLPYYGDDQAQVVEMRFREPGTMDAADFSALFVVPREGVSVAEVEAGLDRARFETWVEGLEQGGLIEFAVPRFEASSQAKLIPVFRRLGVERAFDPVDADFSGITDRARIFISDIVHQAFLKVDEAGAEAAAATAVTFHFTSVLPLRASVIADRPFLVFLRQPSTGAILFAARVAAPDTVDSERWEQVRAYFGEDALLTDDNAVARTSIGEFWVGDFPWIYHEGFHWIYAAGHGMENMWWWRAGSGWLWTSDAIFPNFWCEAVGGWRYWAAGTSSPPWFYDYTAGAWIAGW